MERQRLERMSASLRAELLTRMSQYGVSVADAEDLVQDTMMKLWLLRAEVNGEEHARALAFRILRHLTLDKVKRRRRTVEDADMAALPSQQATDSLLIEEENDRWLARQLDYLPPTERQILVLRQQEQLTTEVIAAILGIKTESVTTLLARARKRLMQWKRN